MTKAKRFNIIQAIHHPDLFGSLPALHSLQTWASWITWLKSVFALPMDEIELAIYQKCTGRTQPPATQPSEIYTVVGRRGGKSFISSLTAVFIACFSNFKPYLNAGERAAILILARDRDQAKIVFSYVSGILRAIAPLSAMIAVERADEIELDNDVIIMVKTSDFRAIRGLTVAAAILDEVAFWDSEGVSPDREVLTALRPATSTIPNAKLIAISTPYSQAGSLYEAHRDHYGKDDEHTLVWVAESRAMNPTLDAAFIQREIERDPDAAQAEWLATFRTDLQAAFSPESLEACTVKGRSELPASPIIEYRAFCDPSGGKVDAFTVAIGHKSERAVIDLVRAWDSPFDPSVVVGEVAEVLKGYGCLNVTGDKYAAEWPISSFRSHGISYQQCELSKSDLYLSFVPVTNSSAVELPDDKRLLTQLRRLERKRGRAGKDTVDHPPRLHDDLSNAVAGVSYLLATAKNARPEFNPSLHISREKLKLAVGNWPLVIGVSYDEGIAASVIGQVYNAEIRIFAAFLTEAMSLRRHIEEHVKPWLSTNLSNLPKTPNAPKLRLLGAYEDDPQGKSDTHQTVREALPAEWCSITKPWEQRRDAMLEILVKAQAFSFKPVVQINWADTQVLSQALNGRVYEKSQIEKKTYRVLDAFALLVVRLKMWETMSKDLKPPRTPPSAMAS
jgi:Terminase large subunit, ATPase domain